MIRGTTTAANGTALKNGLQTANGDMMYTYPTPALFKAFPTPKAMAAASLPELEELSSTPPTSSATRQSPSRAQAAASSPKSSTAKSRRPCPNFCASPASPAKRRRPRLLVQDRRRHRRGHTRPAHLPPPRPHSRDHPGKSRARPDAPHPAACVDRLHPPYHLARPPGLHRPQAPLRRLPPRTSLLRPRQNLLLPLAATSFAARTPLTQGSEGHGFRPCR